jgi:hypothetical protein
VTELRAGVDADEDAVVWAVVAAQLQASVRLDGAGPCPAQARGTRLGGGVLAAKGFEWPRADDGTPLAVLAQVDCDQLNAALGRDVLPAGTLLTFFYDAAEQRGWGYDLGDRQYWRVHAAEAASAVPVVAPEGVPSGAAVGCGLRRVLTIPERWEPAVQGLRDAGRGAVNRLYDRVGAPGKAPVHRMFGWPEPVQGPMQLECELAAHGVPPGSPEAHRGPLVERLRAGAADWVLLLQVDSDAAAGWMWGDTGTLYYWIRRQDLAAGDFSRVWGIGQCC